MKIVKMSKVLGLFLSLALTLAACGGGGSGSGGSDQGTLAVSLVDSSTENYLGVYVTIDEVAIHSNSNGWETIATPGGTYNLLELVNGVREELALTQLDSGSFTQLRLLLGSTADNTLNLLGDPHPFPNYLIDDSDAVHELKVPSGYQSGIKIVKGFTINDNQTTELILDFDAMKSVVKAGKSGKHLLKPTIKMLATTDGVLLSGLVDDGTLGLAGAMVSAQTYDGNLSLDPAERVDVLRSTVSGEDDSTTAEDETGEYKLFLAAGNYNLLAYLNGYEPICRTVDLVAGTLPEEDFTLTPALTGIISGTVDIVTRTPVEDQHVTIDFRQDGLCGVSNRWVNVKSVAVEDGGTYDVELPVGTYLVVSSTPGMVTQEKMVTVTHNADIRHNPAF